MEEHKEENTGRSAAGGLFEDKSQAEPVSGSGKANVNGGMESLTKMARVLFMCLRVVIVLVLAYLLVSGVFRVDEQNEAMLFRFGALQTRVLDPEHGETAILTSGRWYWAWPYPIDWVKELPAQKTVTVSTERLFEPIVPYDQDTRGYLTPGADGYMMCLNEEIDLHDGQRRSSNGIVHAVGEVNYRITDAKKYYLSFYDEEDERDDVTLDIGLESPAGEQKSGKKAEKPEAKRGTRGIIRLMLGNAMLVEAVTWQVEDLRNMSRRVDDRIENFEDCVEERLSRYIDEVDMGIEVQSVKVTIHLPAAVRREFEYVFSAKEQSGAVVQLASQEADAIKKAAQSSAYKIESEAKSERDRLIVDAEQDCKNFQNELEILRDMGGDSSYVETVLLARYVEVLNRIYKKVENKVLVQQTGEQRPRVRLRMNVPARKKKRGNAAGVGAAPAGQ